MSGYNQWRDFIKDPGPMDRDDKLAFIAEVDVDPGQGTLHVAYERLENWAGSELEAPLKNLADSYSNFAAFMNIYCDSGAADRKEISDLWWGRGGLCVENDELEQYKSHPEVFKLWTEFKRHQDFIEALVIRWKALKSKEDKLWKE